MLFEFTGVMKTEVAVTHRRLGAEIRVISGLESK
jgi:hypothetical protein